MSRGKRPREVRVVQGTDEWQAERRGRLTSTKTAPACGLDRYQTPRACAERMIRERRGLPDPDPATDEEAARRSRANLDEGHRKEDAIARQCAALLGYRRFRETGIFVDADDPWMADSPDRVLEDEFLGGALVPVECKNSIWTLAAVPKPEHLVQSTHHMRVLRSPYALLCYGHGERSVRVFRVRYSPALWAWIEERLRVFRRCVWEERPQDLEATTPDLTALIADAWYGHAPSRERLEAVPAWRHGVTPALPPAPRWEPLVEQVDPYEWRPRDWDEYFAKKEGGTRE